MKWGVYHVEHGWLVDTGVGGTYSFDVDQAQWFGSEEFAKATLKATDIIPSIKGWPSTEWLAELAKFLFVRLK